MASEIIGERIRQRREELGFSMEELANKLGVHKSSIQRYETNTFKTIKIPILNALAEILEVPAEWLSGEDNTEPERNGELDRLLFSARDCLNNLSGFNEQKIFDQSEEVQIGQFLLDYLQSLEMIVEAIKEKQNQWTDSEAKFDSSELFDDEKELLQARSKFFRSGIWDKTSVISEWIYDLPNLYVSRANLKEYLEKCKDKNFTNAYGKIAKKYK